MESPFTTLAWLAALCCILIQAFSDDRTALAQDTKPANATTASPKIEPQRPNVLFLAVDDLNDWTGCLGGHPQTSTSNIDRLAQQSVLFEQAYFSAPLCSPSRTSIRTGLRPSTTGVYGTLTWFRDIPKYRQWVTIPQYFRQHGYMAWTRGKIYHQAKGCFQIQSLGITNTQPVWEQLFHPCKSDISTGCGRSLPIPFYNA